MTIKKCDRCGQIIEETPIGFLAELCAEVNDLFGKKPTEYLLVEKGTSLLSLDLCAKCKQSLTDWVNKGGKEE